MSSKDSDFIANRYVNIDNGFGNEYIPFYDRKDIDNNTPTECLICIEAENEMYTKFAHPKGHLEAHTRANMIAEKKAIKEKEEYIDNYMFF